MLPHNLSLLLFLFMFAPTTRRHWTPWRIRLAWATPSVWSCAKSTGDFLAICSFLHYLGDREKRSFTGPNLCHLTKTLKWPPPDPPVCPLPPCLASTSRRLTPTGTPLTTTDNRLCLLIGSTTSEGLGCVIFLCNILFHLHNQLCCCKASRLTFFF